MMVYASDRNEGWQNPQHRGIAISGVVINGLSMDTKTQLLDSAERAARERGYDGFSYADIAAEVGIRKASIHYHFPSKSDLGLALIQRYRAGIEARFFAISQSDKNAGEKLQTYLEFYRSGTSNGATVCLCVAFAISRDNLAEPILRELDQFHDGNIKWLTGVYSQAIDDQSITGVGDPAEEAAMTLATVEGAHLIARSSKTTKRFDAAIKQLKSRII